jgi:hypothetical protein
MFVPFDEHSLLLDKRYIQDYEFIYLPFDYSKSKYATQKQLLNYVNEIHRQNNDAPPGVSYTPDGDCPFITHSMKLINDYLKKNNVSLEKFLQVYPRYKSIFVGDFDSTGLTGLTGLNNWDRLKFICACYETLEKDLSSIRYSKFKSL